MISQIDLAPTILGLMNLNYESNFMGYDLFATSKGKERIFISTYEGMGFIKSDTMVVLSPTRKIREL
jgi:phosphoglycerol transferase MdoB-like AlkP superfamily enzyme